MHLWTIRKWEKRYPIPTARSGLRLKFDKAVDPEVKRACKEFAVWMRKEYYFPVRVPLYIKADETIKAMDGDLVVGTFFRPSDPYVEPYGCIATGDYTELFEKRGKDNALAAILRTIAHELTHYFQWINNLQLTEIGTERQATQYADYILQEYAETRDHP